MTLIHKFSDMDKINENQYVKVIKLPDGFVVNKENETEQLFDQIEL